jgi:hypothetical protein
MGKKYVPVLPTIFKISAVLAKNFGRNGMIRNNL